MMWIVLYRILQSKNRIEGTNTMGNLFCRQRKVLPETGNRNEGTETGNCSFLQLKDVRALVGCSYKHYAVALPWNFVMVRQKVDTVGLSMLLRMVLFLQTRWRQVGSTELQDVFWCRYGMQSDKTWEQIAGLEARGLISVDTHQRISLCSGIISRVF